MDVNSGLKKKFGMVLYIAIFLVVEIVFGYFIIESRNLFWESSIQDGGYLAQAQVEKIETRMEDFSSCLTLAGKYVDEMVTQQQSDLEIQKWMKSYCEKISDGFGDNVLDLYAVVDGRIVAANPWEGDDAYDFSSRPWYLDALATAPGVVVFSDLYTDAITGQNVFTVSQALSDVGNVVAMDVYLASENWMGFSELPDGYALQVYDPNQTLAYSIGYIDLGIFQQDILGNASNEVSYYAQSAVEGRNLYVQKKSNGWSVVIAIPSEQVISGDHMLLMNLGLGLSVLNIVLTAVFLIQHLRNSRYLHQDILTGLLNKAYLMKQLRRRMKRGNGTLLIVDLDNFKKINDNYGHDHGDLVLIQVAEVLRTCFRKTDCIGRFGGDEFIIYTDGALTDDVLNSKVQEVIRQVTLLSQQYPLSDLAISIGGCRCKKGDKYLDIFKRADEALYKVKNSGKCGFAMSQQA